MIIYQSIKPAQQAAITLQASEALTVKEMAATMQDMAAAGEAVTPENLKLHGFSDSAIMRFAAEAASLARKNAVKAVRA
ncbi:hypothetical protein ACI0FM_08505 [Paenochrobactrum sp. BZR 588]|uniref:hypothetical protein n=1 Tax=unclassified Paenochrobactrum TaxID=2639760 RepID=UPI00385234E6